jgi:hypothetical protein
VSGTTFMLYSAEGALLELSPQSELNMSRLSRRRAYMEIMAPELDNVSGRFDWVGIRPAASRRELDVDIEEAGKMASTSAASNDRHHERTSAGAVRRT